MLTHAQVWSAIDALAARNNISVSRLARNAGLDPTTFNPSKRRGGDGRLRWPSTESLAKVMEATGTRMDELSALIGGGGYGGPGGHGVLAVGMSEGQSPFRSALTIPLIGLAQAGAGGFFDDAGLPSGEGWDAVAFPNTEGETVYALEVSGESMEPVYRDGDRLLVSPGVAVRRGDRVVVRTREGEVMAKVLSRRTVNLLELESLNPAHAPRSIPVEEVDWVARIIWASQ